MRQESVFALIHWYAKPMPRANRRLNFLQKLTPDREQTSADAAHTARPVLGNLVKLEGRVVNHRLNRGNDAVIRVSYSNSAAHRPDVRLAEARCQLGNCVWMKNAIRIDRNYDLCRGLLHRIANRSRLSAVRRIAPRPYAYVGEVALRPEHPLEAVVHRTVVLRNHFKFFRGIVALADALDRLVDRLTFVEARHQHAYCGLVAVIFLYFRARERHLQNDSHDVLHHGNQQAKNHDQPQKYWSHTRHAPTSVPSST